jgi:soluble lytic murein transglycosylase-like protein
MLHGDETPPRPAAPATVPAAIPVTPAAQVDVASLEDTIAYLEGTPVESEEAKHEQPRRTAIQAVVQHLGRRHTGLSQREIQRVAETIIDACTEHEIEPKLVLGVIQVESAGYHRAVSPVGALGLMQIMPPTGKALAAQEGIEWHGPETLFDPVVNVRLGIAYLQELSDRYGHIPTALIAYNWGPTRLDRRIRSGASMPKIYAEQVMRAVNKVGLQKAESPRDSSTTSSTAS